MKPLLKVIVCSLLLGCCMVPVSLHAQNHGIDTGDMLSNEEYFSKMEDEPVVETGEIVRIYASDNKNAYMELDSVYVDDITILNVITTPIPRNGAGVIPGIMLYKTVTVTKSLANFDSTLVYREYNDRAQAWYNGTLNLQSMVKKGNVYVASYSGFLILQN